MIPCGLIKEIIDVIGNPLGAVGETKVGTSVTSIGCDITGLYTKR